MPPLMEQLGFEKNEYGNYENHFRYHSRLLALGGVFPPMENFSPGYLSNYANLFFYATLVLLAAAALCSLYTAPSPCRQIKNQAAWHVPVCRGDAGTDPGVRAAGRDRGVTASHCCGNRPGAAFTASWYAFIPEFWETFIYFPFTLRFSWGIALTAAFCFLSYRTGIRFTACEKDG